VNGRRGNAGTERAALGRPNFFVGYAVAAFSRASQAQRQRLAASREISTRTGASAWRRPTRFSWNIIAQLTYRSHSPKICIPRSRIVWDWRTYLSPTIQEPPELRLWGLSCRDQRKIHSASAGSSLVCSAVQTRRKPGDRDSSARGQSASGTVP
jgi:hypothetical protein